MPVSPPVHQRARSLADADLSGSETPLPRPVEPADRVDLEALVQKVRSEHAGEDEARVSLQRRAYLRPLLGPLYVAEAVGVDDLPIASLDVLQKQRLAAPDDAAQDHARELIDDLLEQRRREQAALNGHLKRRVFLSNTVH